MDGKTATLIDDPAARLNEQALRAPFCLPIDWDERNFRPGDDLFDGIKADTQSAEENGFDRLIRGHDAGSSRGKRKPRRSTDRLNGSRHAGSSSDRRFRCSESNLQGNDEAWSAESEVPASASSTSADTHPTPPSNDTSTATPEADSGTESAVVMECVASKTNVAANAEPSPATAEPCPFQQLRNLSKIAANGDGAAIAEIRRILDGNEELWRQLGDVERTTEAMLIELLAGSPAVKESVRRTVVELKQSLLGQQSTPLERMAVGRVVACWLFANFADRWCGWAVKQGGRASDLARLLEAAEKRYGTALKSLKLVQSIKSPADQNIGQTAHRSTAG